MNLSVNLKKLTSDVKKILPDNISKVMAILLEENPEDFVAGCQFKPGRLQKHFLPDQEIPDFKIQADFNNVLISWYFTQTVVFFDKEFSNELNRTEGGELEATDFLRLTGNPVYIPFENEVNSVLGCMFAFCGARYENSKEKGTVMRIDFVLYHNNNSFSKGGWAYQINDGIKIPHTEFKDSLKEKAEIDESTANEITNKLFYLLSDEPESILWRRNNLDFRPEIVKHKRRANTIYAPRYPRIALLGSEFGEEIRQASTRMGSDRTVRPHIRRAHWHTFLCGIGRAQRKIRWIKPVFVHSRDVENQNDAR